MSSSYLGHGAKYWADRYFEQHTQTRLPDDPADLSWREKYLALEKECEHYQATLSEMRVEIEYLRSQQPTSIVADPDLQRKAEKWKLGYTRLAAALKEKEKQYDALSAEKQRLECHLQERELYRGKTAEQWAELYFSEQRNYQKATSDLQESDSEIQTLNTTVPMVSISSAHNILRFMRFSPAGTGSRGSAPAPARPRSCSRCVPGPSAAAFPAAPSAPGSSVHVQTSPCPPLLHIASQEIASCNSLALL